MKGSLSRRELLEGLAGVGAAALLSGRQVFGQGTTAKPHRLDIHHHFGSPKWRARVGEVKRPGWQQFQDYEPGKDIDAMDQAGIATAFLSCTEPGVWFGDEFAKERQEAIALSRDMNEYGAKLVSDYK